MPELPEVHTTASILNKLVSGLSIQDVWTDYGGSFHKGKQNIKDATYFARFKKEVIGKKIVSASRRGKNVLIHLSSGLTILVHMKMTGHILYGTYVQKKTGWEAVEPEALKDPFNRHVHLVFTLSNNKHLALCDSRKFAKVAFTETAELTRHPDLAHLGPEPIHEPFSLGQFVERVTARPSGRIKSVLMDQSVIAGIGNIYSDEILYLTGIHPETRVRKIDTKKLSLMYRSMKAVLKKGVDFGGDSTSDYRNPHGVAGKFHYHHKVYRETGKPCPKKGCRGIIRRKVVGGRSAHFCDTHQKLL